jgi:P-type Cu2+ transporter
MTLQADDIPAPAAAPAPVDARCAHCDSTVPRGLIEPDAEHQFCCAGCRAVFETLHSCGLAGYYRLREAAEIAPRPARRARSRRG